METLLEAIARLRTLGYRLDLAAVPGGRLHCGGREEDLEAAALTVDETVRFEGASDPDDEAILLALSSPDGHRGLYSAAFGANTTSDDVDVLHALVRR
jgi:hypothetical protein